MSPKLTRELTRLAIIPPPNSPRYQECAVYTPAYVPPRELYHVSGMEFMLMVDCVASPPSNHRPSDADIEDNDPDL